MSTATVATVPEPESPPDTQPAEPPASVPGRRRSKRALIWVALVTLTIGATGYAVWRVGKPNAAPRARGDGGGGDGPRTSGRGASAIVPVGVANATRAAIPVYLNGLGNATAFYTVTIKSRVDGQIVKVDFKEGDFVEAGQVLVEIDPRPYQVQLESAQASLARDQALLGNAKVDLERYKDLVATEAAPKQQLDTQVALIAQDEAIVKQDEASIDNAKLQLTYAKITAPITGVLGLRLIDPGNIVHASDNTGMVVITQLQPISVLFTIPEDNLPMVTRKIRAGVKLRVEAFNRDHSKVLASGVLQTIDNQIDNTTGTSKLKAVFDNKDFALFPQQFVNVRLLVDTLSAQLVIPNAAIQNGQQGAYVYVVDHDSRVHLKTVKVGITTETSSQILDGLTDGDRVVVDGADRLVENAQVRVRSPGDSKGQ